MLSTLLQLNFALRSSEFMRSVGEFPTLYELYNCFEPELRWMQSTLLQHKFPRLTLDEGMLHYYIYEYTLHQQTNLK